MDTDETRVEQLEQDSEPRHRVIGRRVFCAGAIVCATAIFFINVGNATLYMFAVGVVLVLAGSMTRPFGEL